MNIDLELIEQLVIKEFYGIITEEEKAELEDATDRFPEAWSRQQEVKRKLESDELKSYLEEHTDEEQFLKLTQRIRQNQRRRNIVTISSFAAAAAVLCFFAIWYITRRDVPDGNMTGIASIVLPKDTVILELPNEQKILLGDGRQQINAGNIHISTETNVLTYQTKTTNKADLAAITVPAGKEYKVYLSDSSIVHMNSMSKMTFPLQFSGDSREITISGEAFMEVKPRTEPFIVHLPKGTIQVLGTSFNVNTYDEEERISLVSGGVKVLSDDDSLMLKIGREAVIVEGAIKDHGFDKEKVLGWRNGEYEVDNLTIREICKVLFRIYGVNVMVDNDQVAELRFSGKIKRSKSIESFLNGLKVTNYINYFRDSEGVFHIK